MPNQTPLLLENEIRPDLKVRIAFPALPISSDIPPGPHTEPLTFEPRSAPPLAAGRRDRYPADPEAFEQVRNELGLGASATRMVEVLRSLS